MSVGARCFDEDAGPACGWGGKEEERGEGFGPPPATSRAHPEPAQASSQHARLLVVVTVQCGGVVEQEGCVYK